MEKEQMKMYGKSFHVIDDKNRLTLPARFQVKEGTELGIIKEKNSMCRAYLYSVLIQLFETLQKGSYSSENAEENQKLLERVCGLLLKVDVPRKVDCMGRFALPSEMITTCDGFPTYEANKDKKNRVVLIGEGSGCSIISNEATLKEYASGMYGCNIDSYIRK